MSLNTPLAITQLNYGSLETALRQARVKQTEAGYPVDFCCIKVEKEPISNVDVLFVNSGFLAFKRAGISISITPQSEVQRGYFIPSADKLRYKENPNHLQSDGIRWISVENGLASVVWVPEGYSRLKVAKDLILPAIKRIGPSFKKYDPGLVARTLEDVYE